jgi:hypothetical protein
MFYVYEVYYQGWTFCPTISTFFEVNDRLAYDDKILKIIIFVVIY